MKLSEMRALLADGQVRLTKSLGQNFLHDANQIRRIIQAAELTGRDRVLEVGPGLGPLTETLLREAGQVLAIETDRRLVARLQERWGLEPRLELVHADALEYFRAQLADWSGWKLVANLPFSIASPLLVELALAPTCPALAVITLQVEVARRFVAAPGDADYGVLTLLIQQRYEPRGWFRIPPTCFFPAPSVDAACMRLARRPVPLMTSEERRTFVRLVKRSFSQRRKMMAKLLRAEWPTATLAAAFAAVGLALGTRAEKVSLAQFVQLTKTLRETAPA